MLNEVETEKPSTSVVEDHHVDAPSVEEPHGLGFRVNFRDRPGVCIALKFSAHSRSLEYT